MSEFAKLNDLTLGIDGVYQVGSQETAFNYSDGEESEKKLFQILSKSRDLSSNSKELEQCIDDWPSEYHLSSSRANLLRPLDFSGITRVLELGCGCGSISRFLGEQEGISVDAIEGSPIRAGLAALRCRDLDNVSISTANFNDVEFPENYYDLVLFIGVTEYAGRFSSKESDHEALQDLLKLAKRASKKEGATLVAIENRLGMKYLMGASEDHYGQPFVGLHDYPESTGIRTYSRKEWLEQTSAFKQTHFAYPFPDYKVPNLIIDGSSIESHSSEIIDALSQCKSRDYLSSFNLGANENEIWSGLLQSNSFVDHANSFFIILSDEQKTIDGLCSFKIARYDELELEYLNETEESFCPKQHAMNLHKVEEHLNAQITQLKNHSLNLEAKVELMSSSVGWRFLNGLRRLFRKNTI